MMRVTDVFLALPAPLLAIAVVAAIGPGFGHTLIAVAIVWWPWYARIVRGEITALRHRPQTEAANLAKVSRRRLWFRHLLPGSVPAVLVLASLDVGGLILILAGLSFLGLGAPAPAPELGAMSAQGLRFLLSSWWVPVVPAAAVAVVAFVSNLAGDATARRDGDQGVNVLKLIVRRLLEMVVVLMVLTAVVFLLRQLQPADAARVALGPPGLDGRG